MAGYIALIHKDEGTSYGVSFPDVPGCVTAADTVEEAIAKAAEVLAFHFDGMREDGDPIPKPCSYDDLRHVPEFVEDAEGAIVTVVLPQTEHAAA